MMVQPTATITIDQSDVEPGVVVMKVEQEGVVINVRLVFEQGAIVAQTLAFASLTALGRLLEVELARRTQENQADV